MDGWLDWLGGVWSFCMGVFGCIGLFLWLFLGIGRFTMEMKDDGSYGTERGILGIGTLS